MEIVLQWLDDLEDLIFALPLVWERIRLPFLMLGLLAAIALHAEDRWEMAGWWVPLCSTTASAIIVGWLTGLAFMGPSDTPRQAQDPSSA